MGMIVILINFVYLIFSIVVGVVTYFLLSKRNILGKYKRIAFSFVIFLTVLLAPFWDLIIQKGIKTYYENYKMSYTINAYPEKDKDGRIESLGMSRVLGSQNAGRLRSQKSLEKLRGILFRDFIEFYFYDSLIEKKNENNETVYVPNYDYNLGYLRVYLNRKPIIYEKIQNEIEFKARYQVLAKTTRHYFYEKTVAEFWDKKKNILMSKGMKISFPVQDAEEKFRTKYLVWWMSAAGSPFQLRGLDNTHKVYENLFFNKDLN